MFTNEQLANVKLQHSNLLNRIKNLTQNDWIKACKRLGLDVDKTKGRGSHCCVYEPNCKTKNTSEYLIATIQRNLYPQIQTKILKRVVCYGIESAKYTEQDVWLVLKVKK